MSENQHFNINGLSFALGKICRSTVKVEDVWRYRMIPGSAELIFL